MTKQTDGGAAFPFREDHADGTPYSVHPGMSLRDWFAGQAIAGMMSGGFMPPMAMPSPWDDPDFSLPHPSKGGGQPESEQDDRSSLRDFADAAYAIADALLTARNDGGEG